MEKINNKKPMKKEYKLAIIIFTVCLLVVVFRFSYALFAARFEGERVNSLESGTIVIELDDTAGEGINLSNAIPVTDSTGASGAPYTFEVRNIGDATTNYTLSLVDDEQAYIDTASTDKKLPWNVVKFNVIKDGEEVVSPTILSTNNGVIELGSLPANTTANYEIRLWLDGEGTNASHMGMHFHTKLKLNANIG